METLSPRSLRDCAINCIQIANIIEDIIRTRTFQNSRDFDTLLTLQRAILLEADSFIAASIEVAVEDALDAAANIVESTNQVKKALNTIEKISDILNIATAVLNLVTAIAIGVSTGNPIIGLGGSLRAISNLLDTAERISEG